MFPGSLAIIPPHADVMVVRESGDQIINLFGQGFLNTKDIGLVKPCNSICDQFH